MKYTCLEKYGKELQTAIAASVTSKRLQDSIDKAAEQQRGFDKYRALQRFYKISRDGRSLEMSGASLGAYEVVITHIKTEDGRAHYRVIKNAPGLGTYYLALICSEGNTCFGYDRYGSNITVFVD